MKRHLRNFRAIGPDKEPNMEEVREFYCDLDEEQERTKQMFLDAFHSIMYFHWRYEAIQGEAFKPKTDNRLVDLWEKYMSFMDIGKESAKPTDDVPNKQE